MKQEKTYIDLHTHTEYSDGLYTTPKQNVMLAIMKGLDIFAITDHDTIRGYNEAKEAAQKTGITLIAGTEITSPKYHLLALNFDPKNKGLLKFLDESINIQNDRCKKRVEILRDYGFPLSFEEVKNNFPNSRLAKYNIFATMILNPECRSIMENEFPLLTPYEKFRKYFGKNFMFNGMTDTGMDEKEAIDVIHNAGGFIGIAHPPKDIKSMTEMDKLVSLGIDFVEVQPNFRGKENGRYTTQDFIQYAREKGLALTYGSDYHGPTFDRPILDRGENVLSSDLEEILNQGFVKISKSDGVVC